GFYDRLQQPNNNRFRFYSSRLYTWFINPIVEDLKKNEIQTLVVSPDGILGLIPFGALFDGKHYLIEKYAVAVVPGITLTLQQQKFKKMNALACGISCASGNFPALPHVSEELHAVKSIIGGTILENDIFTTDTFMETLSQTPFNILHIATHGNFGPTPDQTFLLTHSGKFTMEQLRQLVFHLKFRNQPVELITLSACQTAAGDERSALGLGGTALNTGVETALATLWTVDDQTAFMMVKSFYETLLSFKTTAKPGQTKSKALQTAQVRLMGNPSFKHPFYWAPFVLIGNWL
ncbi:MAG: CHAT domain-containing protein, partial [Thermodesulfobacteriota bacterium]|nr:CHAT domain-containing protein [Thermodesulfobacteriota bacterium]